MSVHCDVCGRSDCIDKRVEFLFQLRGEIENVRNRKAEAKLVSLAKALPRQHQRDYISVVLVEELRHADEERVIPLLLVVEKLREMLPAYFTKDLESWLPDTYSEVYARVSAKTRRDLVALKNLFWSTAFTTDCLNAINRNIKFQEAFDAMEELGKIAHLKPVSPIRENDFRIPRPPVCNAINRNIEFQEAFDAMEKLVKIARLKPVSPIRENDFREPRPPVCNAINRNIEFQEAFDAMEELVKIARLKPVSPIRDNDFREPRPLVRNRNRSKPISSLLRQAISRRMSAVPGSNRSASQSQMSQEKPDVATEFENDKDDALRFVRRLPGET